MLSISYFHFIFCSLFFQEREISEYHSCSSLFVLLFVCAGGWVCMCLYLSYFSKEFGRVSRAHNDALQFTFVVKKIFDIYFCFACCSWYCGQTHTHTHSVSKPPLASALHPFSTRHIHLNYPFHFSIS